MDSKLLLHPDDPKMNERAPDDCHIKLETTKGIVRMEMRREWAANGVDRFYNLVRHGYYDQSAVFRIRAGMWAQFGINGDPKIAQAWRNKTIPDDARKESNVRGALAFAFKDTDGRTVFEMKDCEVPAAWSQLAVDILVPSSSASRRPP
jgi:hypothetical protein